MGDGSEAYTRGYSDGFLARQPEVVGLISRQDLQKLRNDMDTLLRGHGTAVTSTKREDESAALRAEVAALREEARHHECAAAEARALSIAHAELQKAYFLLQKDRERHDRRPINADGGHDRLRVQSSLMQSAGYAQNELLADLRRQYY